MLKWDLVMMLSIPSSRKAHIVAKSAVGDGTGDRIMEAMVTRGQQLEGCWLPSVTAACGGVKMARTGRHTLAGTPTSLFLPPYSGNVSNAEPPVTPIHKIMISTP
jgi:hypothetical protein